MPVISISMASSPLSPFNSLAPPERESEGGRQNKSAQLSNKRKRGGTASSKKRRGNDGGILLLSPRLLLLLLYGYNNNSCQSGGERRGSRWRRTGAARRTRMSGIPVAPQQRAYKVGPVGEPRSAPRPSRLLYLRRAANFTRDIQNGAAASPARRPRFEAAAGHCSALHASICKN